MNNIDTKGNYLPSSIKFLFDNEKLDMLKVLCLLYVIYNKNKKKYTTLPEIVYYYSIINFDQSDLITEKKYKYIHSNLTLNFDKKLNLIIIKLAHLKLIEIKGTIFIPNTTLKVRLSIEGQQLTTTLNSNLFLALVEKYAIALNEKKYSLTNLKILKEGTHNE